MTPMGIGIVGTGNIAGGYARDALTHPEIRLVAVTDLDVERATSFATEHGCRIHATLEDLLADPPGARGRPTRLQREAAGAPSDRSANPGRARPVTRPATRLLAVDVPWRGPADGHRPGPIGPARDRAGDLRGGRLGSDRDMAPGARAVLRRRRPLRRRCLSADS